ncbi:hypothetical protein [Rugamonas aquatica]|uniref:Uncharacterized protein n=1 Tax=Rugamonas aquatica TaxID=2743357 RepID=A0A6A7N6Y2_9BURK|nr:hypothetical protein [Rugamonas aquatica]MQA40759.1 hypothetical protein [Rugamonas aquatica]
MKSKLTAALLAALCSTGAWAATGPAWAWSVGKISNNGSVQVQALNGGGSYDIVQNPTGAVAKANQSAMTQPPTVIVQSTGSAPPFNYKDDCWVVNTVAGRFFGAGKVDAGKFTGLMAPLNGMAAATAGKSLLSAMLALQMDMSNTQSVLTYCGADVNCLGAGGDPIGVVMAMPLVSYEKCYP